MRRHNSTNGRTGGQTVESRQERLLQSRMPRIDLTHATPARFWLLQIVGWSIYGLDRYLSERSFFPIYFIYLCVAFLLTVVFLRPLYRAVYRRQRHPLALLGISVVASVAAALLWLVVSWAVFVALGFARWPDTTWSGYLAQTFVTTLTHHKPFLFLSWSGIYFGMKLWTDAQDRERTSLAASALARQAELQALRAQLNPHFLFNALNSTGALIQEDPARAERVLDELARFLRHSLTDRAAEEAPLADEMAAIRAYLDIEQLRYEEQLEVAIEATPRALARRVPALLFQPLVENAVKYGMRTSPMPLHLAIGADADDKSLTLTVRHTGRLVAPGAEVPGAGVGLANVRRRLELAYPGRHSFRLWEEDGWVCARIAVDTPAEAACAS